MQGGPDATFLSSTFRLGLTHRFFAPMPHCARLVLIAVLFWMLGAVPPLHAQEADSLEADTSAADTMTTETQPDPAAQDTGDAARDRMATAQSRTDSIAARRDSIRALRDSIRQVRKDSVLVRRDSIQTVRSRQARTAAERWLQLTDAGRFDESWLAADSTLQNNIPRAEWIDQGRRSRNRLDEMRRRTLTRVAYRDSTNRVPGSTPVVLLQYLTQFERGKTLEALVTTKRDDAWKVAGYRVVPAPDTMWTDTTQIDSVKANTR